jgi:2-polyprenyl-3-methyl-5-hydroxy-6-metoxy-1,4-benzoquinol methylase
VTKLADFFAPHTFDAVVCFDVIEHIKKVQLIGQMEAIACRKVIICTPNGFMHQQEEQNPLQSHHSGWTTEGFIKKDYEVKGILGSRFLRKEQHEYTINRLAGFILSEIMQVFHTYHRPYSAAALMAIKEQSNDSSKKSPLPAKVSSRTQRKK